MKHRQEIKERIAENITEIAGPSAANWGWNGSKEPFAAEARQTSVATTPTRFLLMFHGSRSVGVEV